MAYQAAGDVPKKRLPEETGKECISDMQLRVFDYLENRRRTEEPEEDFYSPSAPFKGGIGVNVAYTQMKLIHSMVIYGEKNASHCMTVDRYSSSS